MKKKVLKYSVALVIVIQSISKMIKWNFSKYQIELFTSLVTKNELAFEITTFQISLFSSMLVLGSYEAIAQKFLTKTRKIIKPNHQRELAL